MAEANEAARELLTKLTNCQINLERTSEWELFNVGIDLSTGQIGHEAYCNERDWQSYNGDPLPGWDEVDAPIQNGWEVAGRAVLEAFRQS